ncbi:MAG: L-serine ammonia-lyase [Pseudomonadota bacterium]
MFLSVFEIFKIGIGPSSSHTMGPMTAAARFLDALRGGAVPEPGARGPARLRCSLHGSLAFTGKGHATDRAVILGLLGESPASLDPDSAEALIAHLTETKALHPKGLPPLAFDPGNDLVFDYEHPLPLHANALMFQAFDDGGTLHMQETYYSIGGGFVLTEGEMRRPTNEAEAAAPRVPYPFKSAAEMLKMGDTSGRSVAEMKRANEEAANPPSNPAETLDEGMMTLWHTMRACMDRGLEQDGLLPGGLQVKRRAKGIRDALEAEGGRNDAPPHFVNDWISLYAMAVNEENAAGGRVVTAPTNGAAGVVPAVLRYWLDHVPGSRESEIGTFLLTAAAIGGIVKTNASISGAECGCQAEVGSAAAMAAAGLCAVLGGTNAQIENAAEIALEHHLGMTCDPVAGLVQVPCIERNGLGAVKAVTAASLALRGDGGHFMPLDNCIEAMRQTGRDMSEKYKETSQGGLAVNMPQC